MTEETESAMHPVMQFLLLVVILVMCMAGIGALGIGVVYLFYGMDTIKNIMQNGVSAQVINPLWILQLATTTIPFFAAPYIFAKFVIKEPRRYLKTSFNFNPQLLLIIFVLMFFSAPFMELIININQKMVLPDFLKGVEQWMRRSEAEAAKQTAVLLHFKNLGQMLWALLVVGLLTAIAEEFFFRGAVQAIFTRWTNNPHIGIWIAAILFSAIHMQFFGFFPRLILGVFFGYFVLWSGSIWTSVWAHFLNNGTAVVVTYLYQQKKITMNPDDQHVFNYGAYAFSLIITVFLLLIYRNVTQKKQLPVL